MTVQLYIRPPADSCKEIVSDIYKGLTELGWTNTKSVLYSSNQDEPVENTPGSVYLVTRPVEAKRRWRVPHESVHVEFMKGEQRFLMFVGVEYQYTIELVFYETLFEQGRGLDELKDLFSMLSLPEGTHVRGDGPSEIYGDEKTWRFKGDRLWEAYFYIDQVKTLRWSRIVSCFPELAKNELARIGDKHIVAMGESPYIEEKERVRVFPSKKERKSGVPKWYRGERRP
ncbi:MAG: hypothetical protein E3J35_10305 [Methanomassiliicoccales archaeon]|nr:MAG: hypothetical protein E3J35_10305 [Methanomassiliicoccales archaeon]